MYIYGDGIDKTLAYGSKHSTDEFPAYRTAVAGKFIGKPINTHIVINVF